MYAVSASPDPPYQKRISCPPCTSVRSYLLGFFAPRRNAAPHARCSRPWVGPSPKVTAALRREGERITQKTVAGLMREQQLRSRTVRKYKATTNSRHGYPVAENRVNQHFVADRPHAVWMGDLTYSTPSDVPARMGRITS